MFRRWLKGLAGATPSRCAVCGRWPSQPVCPSCVERFAAAQPRCSRCALPVPAGVGVCGACLRDPPALDRCHAAVSYAYPWSALIGQFKFGGDPGWARSFADLMRSLDGVARALDRAQVVLPMPLSRKRLAERGFNQSLELARLLAPGKTDAHLLLRVRDTEAQTTLGRKERHANVRGAFAVEPLRQSGLRGRRALLVDDVMTSGASLHAAAQVLRAAGAVEVAAVVLARTDQMSE